MCQVLRGHLIVARGYQEILILKSVLSMKMCQVLEVSLLFLWLVMFFLVTCH